MQSDKILSELKGLAEKIGIKVTEQVLKSPGIHVRSGLCKVRGEDRFILDRKLNLGDKVELLADCLCLQDTNGVFLVPQLRDLLVKHRRRVAAKQEEEDLGEKNSLDSIADDFFELEETAVPEDQVADPGEGDESEITGKEGLPDKSDSLESETGPLT
ncbi:MAG: hypothetical protein JEZ02_03500 [Desulfatibacillum sp.]|nr:hypothetical protein [Desulfatibacillum sp.]